MTNQTLRPAHLWQRLQKRIIKNWPRTLAKAKHSGPRLAIVACFYNMRREAERTLLSLTPGYQHRVHPTDYEVLVVENGSSQPLSPQRVQEFGANFHYYSVASPSKSPVKAINDAVRTTTAPLVGIMIDGARLLSPGVLDYALKASQLYPNPIITPLGWHLGPDLQARSMLNGYNQEVEDRLLESIRWPHDPYQLFQVSAPAGSCQRGYFLPMAESNCLFLTRRTFDDLGGYDEGFDTAAGGLANLDLYYRACQLSTTELVILLGEGSFHQFHGGAKTNLPAPEAAKWMQEHGQQYINLRGHPYRFPDKQPVFLGHVPPALLPFMKGSCEAALKEQGSGKG